MLLPFVCGLAVAGLWRWRRLEERLAALEERQVDYTMPPRYSIDVPALPELPEYVGPGLDDDEGWPQIKYL